jgi:hypothetical protein
MNILGPPRPKASLAARISGTVGWRSGCETERIAPKAGGEDRPQPAHPDGQGLRPQRLAQLARELGAPRGLREAGGTLLFVFIIPLRQYPNNGKHRYLAAPPTTKPP